MSLLLKGNLSALVYQFRSLFLDTISIMHVVATFDFTSHSDVKNSIMCGKIHSEQVITFPDVCNAMSKQWARV